jgi:hypothetical protein
MVSDFLVIFLILLILDFCDFCDWQFWQFCVVFVFFCNFFGGFCNFGDSHHLYLFVIAYVVNVVFDNFYVLIFFGIFCDIFFGKGALTHEYYCEYNSE